MKPSQILFRNSHKLSRHCVTYDHIYVNSDCIHVQTMLECMTVGVNVTLLYAIVNLLSVQVE